MYKMTIKDSKYNWPKERFFENFGDLRMYFMTLVKPVKGGSLEKYCTETFKKEFNEEWIIWYHEHFIFDYFQKEDGTMSSGSIQNGMDNRDKNNIEYEIELIQMSVDYSAPLAWGDGLSIMEVFPEDHFDIMKAFWEWTSTIEEDCMDAYRIGLAHSKESMIAYDEFVSCCGSSDVGVEVNGTLYMFGCNYGH